jgi:hypothetical protein
VIKHTKKTPAGASRDRRPPDNVVGEDNRSAKRPDLYARLSVPGAAVTYHRRWASVDALRAIAALMARDTCYLAGTQSTHRSRQGAAAPRCRGVDLLRRQSLLDRRAVSPRAA